MDSREQPIRELYGACAHRDWEAVALLLAGDIRWHELGGEDDSGDYHGRDAVIELLRRLSGAAAATFRLEPEAFLHCADHSALLIGGEIAVYRLEHETIAELWSHVAGYEPEAFSALSGLSAHERRYASTACTRRL